MNTIVIDEVMESRLRRFAKARRDYASIASQVTDPGSILEAQKAFESAAIELANWAFISSPVFEESL